jgi:hypothetical protein
VPDLSRKLPTVLRPDTANHRNTLWDKGIQASPVTLRIQSLHILLGGWEGVTPGPRAPPVQNPTVPFGRPPGTAITSCHRNGGSRRRRGRSIEVAGHGIGRTDPLLDHPCHLDDPRRVTHRARTSSPGDTMVDGLAGRSLIRTCPPRHAAAASGRVFVSRTAHNHRSSRVDSITSIMDCPPT